MCVRKLQNICEWNGCATAAVLNTEASTSNKRFNLLIAARFNSRRDYYQSLCFISHVSSTRMNILRTDIEYSRLAQLCVINFQYVYDILTDSTSVHGSYYNIHACRVLRWLINYITPNISSTANRLQCAQRNRFAYASMHEYDEYDESSD